MIFLIILMVLFAGLILYLLFANFYLEIDSDKRLFRVRIQRFISLKVEIKNSSLILILNIAGLKKEIHPFEKRNNINKNVTKGIDIHKTTKRKIPFHKMIGILKSFKVSKCNIMIDSGDMQLNGILFPVFFWLHTISGKNIGINFQDRNYIQLKIENNIARMGWAYLQSYTIKNQRS